MKKIIIRIEFSKGSYSTLCYYSIEDDKYIELGLDYKDTHKIYSEAVNMFDDLKKNVDSILMKVEAMNMEM